GSLRVRTASASGNMDTQLAGGLLGGPHRFRIDWAPTDVTYFVEGGQVAVHSVAVTNSMRLVASDFDIGNGNVTVNWMRLTPYAAAGSYVSKVFDAGASFTWIHASWVADVYT